MTSFLDDDTPTNACFCCQNQVGEDGYELEDGGFWFDFCSLECLTYFVIKSLDRDTLKLLAK